MPNAEAFGQDANGNVSSRCTLDGQQCLMLLRIEPDFRGFVLTELQALVIRLVKRLSVSSCGTR
jgi:hypothetical protein